MPGNLVGKLALVTGAGSGIGRCVSKLLAREGASIIALDKHIKAAEETVKGMRHESVALEADVSCQESVSHALTESINRFKRPPSVVVNCAGIIRDNFIFKMPESDFQAVVNVNLKGTFLVMQNCAKAMSEYRVHGSIINISSIVARTGNMGQANYAASKAGIEAISKIAAKEFGKYNIRVNCVVPGFIETAMTDQVPQKVKDMMIQMCAMKRLGKPEEVAEVIAFLASDKSSYINGAAIEVTGGY